MMKKPEPKLPDVFYLVGMMWLVQLAQMLWPGNFGQFGIYPRQTSGLLGIPIAPWIHHGWWHLVGNSIPFLVLGFLLQLNSRRIFWKVTAFLVLLSGTGTWLIGSSGYHAGASGLVLGYWSFLLADAYFSRSIKAGLIAAVVFMLYGGLLFTFFDFRAHISWAGHASGMLAGVLAASVLNKTKRISTVL